MNQTSILLVVCSLLFFSYCAPEPDPIPLSLSPLFSDHMVIQQKQKVAVWGKYTPGEKVELNTSWDQIVQLNADENGNWFAQIPSPEAGGPYELNIKTADSTISIKDILVGEVWLASGQSNMEMPLAGWPPNDPIDNSEEEIANADFPKIRMFNVKNNYTVQPIDTVTGEWVICHPDTAGTFSASAYFFARRLHQELGVPIGIINSTWGGTPAEAWTSKEELLGLKGYEKVFEMIEDPERLKIEKDWYGKLEASKVPQTDSGWAELKFSPVEFDPDKFTSTIMADRFDNISSGDIDGAFWIRRTFELSEIDSDYTLDIGAVDDMDRVYINGEEVGATMGFGKYATPRKYTVPASVLKAGENVIEILAIDTGGPGAINSPIVLEDGKGAQTSLEGEWHFIPVAEIFQDSFYTFGTGESAFSERPNIQKFNANTPSVLFNAMIHPVIPFTIRGTIWYQGESNVVRHEAYKELFSTMIQDWRKRWNHRFPFYFVQIAPFNYGGGPDPEDQMSQHLRDAQRRTLELANTGMVVTMDIGNYENIHPGNKQEVGARLAGLALNNTYKKEMVASGPLFKEAKAENGSMLLEFDYVGSGLMAADGALDGFELAGADGKFIAAKAKIEENKVRVIAEGITAPKMVRYAWSDRGNASLFNKEGLPASSFTTEY